MIKVAIYGYFDPIHIGHLELIEKAKALGDYLIVIVNNDNQAVLKKGKPFMKQEERMKIVQAIKGVDEVFLSIDKDRSVCKSLKSSSRYFWKWRRQASRRNPRSCNMQRAQYSNG